MMKQTVFITQGARAALMVGLLGCTGAAEALVSHDHSLCRASHTAQAEASQLLGDGALDGQSPMALQYPRSRHDEWAGWTTHPAPAGARATAIKSAHGALIDEFTMTIVADGGNHPATFRRLSVRSPGFAVMLQDAGGGFTPHVAGEVATYLGTLDNNPDALAAAVILPDNTVFHQVVFSDGEHWVNDGGETRVRKAGTLNFLFPAFVPPPGATASGLLKRVDVGVDLPQHIYNEVYAGDTERALRMVEYSLLGADLLYIRQVGIHHHLGRLVIRASQAQDPYAPLRNQPDPGCQVESHCNFLNMVQEQWNNVLPAGPEHMAMVLREVGGAGLANVGQIGTPRGYSSNDMSAAGDFSIVWRHEAGHNWSLGHYDGGTADAGPEGGTANSNNVLAKFSGSEVALIAELRARRDDVLPNIGPMLLPVPPHAATDSHLVRISAASADIPVLDNDHDANGESLQLLSVNRVSGTLDGQANVVGDTVRYTPQTQVTNGFDVFEYTIADVGTTGTARGFLFVAQVDFGTHYQQDFNAFADGATALGDGSIITQVAGGATSASVQGGALELTPDELFRFGAFTVPMIDVERGFTARFRYNVSSAGTAADAFAFNFGQRIPSASGPQYHGFARGATIEFNTFESPGFRLFINGVEQPAAFVADDNIANGQWQQVEVVWDGSRLSLRVDGQLTFDRLAVDGFVPTSQDGLALSAQTIGLSQRVLIDDIDIDIVTDPIFADGFE